MKSLELNKDIRTAIAGKGLRHYEVANVLGITQYTFSHWLQHELPADRRKQILDTIDSM